ncbi:MAG: hypothetical protein ACOX6P_10795 [Candidatus Merdivicinus sp.]|jgi:hypothetical protein
MDDLTSKVQEILGSEDGMRQLQEMAKALGLSPESGDSAPAPSGAGDLSSMLAGLTGNAEDSAQSDLPISAGDLLKIGNLLQNVQHETPSTALLRALKPLLRPERRKKVEEAVRIMQLLALLPVLQQSGLLKGLLGDGNSD